MCRKYVLTAPTPGISGFRMNKPKRLIIRDESADSPGLRNAPGFLRGTLRTMALRKQANREQRFLIVGRAVLPMLQRMEPSLMKDAEPLLIGRSVKEILASDMAIERALTLFDAVWRAGGVVFQAPNGKALKPGDRKTTLKVCGATVAQGEAYFIKRAVTAIFAKNPKVADRIPESAKTLVALPRLRAMADMTAGSVLFLRDALGHSFEDLFKDDFPEAKMAALGRLKAFQLKALLEGYGRDFPRILNWPADVIESIGDNLAKPEQVLDLCPYYDVMHGAATVRAFGRWDVRLLEGEAEGGKVETDIREVRELLNADFESLAKQPAALVQMTGNFVRAIHAMRSAQDRRKAQDKLVNFCTRYLGYMTPEISRALGLERLLQQGESAKPDPNSLTLPEILGILDGLWSKEGLGRKFFDGGMQTPAGQHGLAGLVKEYLAMRARGSLEQGTDVAAVIAQSTILDKPLKPFLR